MSGRQGEHKHKSTLIEIKVSFQLIIFLHLYFNSIRNSETKCDMIIESRIPGLFRIFNLLSYIIFLAELIRWSYIPFLLPAILILFPRPEILGCPRSLFILYLYYFLYYIYLYYICFIIYTFYYKKLLGRSSTTKYWGTLLTTGTLIPFCIKLRTSPNDVQNSEPFANTKVICVPIRYSKHR